jgi:hypothetical protein
LTHVIVIFFAAGLALAFVVAFLLGAALALVVAFVLALVVAFLLGAALAFLLGAIVEHVTTDFAPFFAGGAVTHLTLGLVAVDPFG